MHFFLSSSFNRCKTFTPQPMVGGEQTDCAVEIIIGISRCRCRVTPRDVSGSRPDLALRLPTPGPFPSLRLSVTHDVRRSMQRAVAGIEYAG